MSSTSTLSPAASAATGHTASGRRRRAPPARRRAPSRIPAAPASRASLAVLVEDVEQRERQRAPVAREAPDGGGDHLGLGADRRRVRAEVAQRRHVPLADDALGVLADDAQHPGDRAVVVVQRAVGERVVGLLGVAAALEEQQQRLVPRRLARCASRRRCAGRCRARSPPTPRAPSGRAPTGTSCRACRAGRRRCRRTSGPRPTPSTSRSATSAGCGRRSSGCAASRRAGRRRSPPSRPRAGRARPRRRPAGRRPRRGSPRPRTRRDRQGSASDRAATRAAGDGEILCANARAPGAGRARGPLQ